MALRTPPSWLQNGSHPAENDRLSMQSIIATSGIIATASLAVTQPAAPGLAVQVATGWGAIVGNYQTNMGVYQFYNDAATQLSVTTADITNPRIDRVVVTINDSYYSGATNNVVFTVIAGTAAPSPAAPATPTNSLSLATIAVAAGATSIINANITDTRVLITTNLPVGDLTEVAAGTGITVTSGTGPIPSVAIDTAVTADLTTAQTLTNKKLSDSTTTIVDVTDATKAIKFDVGGTTAITGTIATGFTTAKTVTIPDTTGTVALTNGVINNTLTTTTGDIIYASSANTPARLGIGSSGQVLKVASGIPSWATASAGSMTKISTTTVTASAAFNIDSLFSSTYRRYIISFQNFLGVYPAGNVKMQLRKAGTTYSGASDYSWGREYLTSNAAGVWSFGGSGADSSFTLWNPDNRATQSTIEIGAVNNSGINEMGYFGSSSFGGGGGAISLVHGMYYGTPSNMDGLRFTITSGSMTGSIVVYGLEN